MWWVFFLGFGAGAAAVLAIDLWVTGHALAAVVFAVVAVADTLLVYLETRQLAERQRNAIRLAVAEARYDDREGW
jgi:membrane protein implicated in regulation of membrane protease activity